MVSELGSEGGGKVGENKCCEDEHMSHVIG